MTEGCKVPIIERHPRSPPPYIRHWPKRPKLRWLNAISSYLSFLHSTILCLPSVFLDASSHFYKWACMSVGNQFFFISLKFGTRVRQGKKIAWGDGEKSYAQILIVRGLIVKIRLQSPDFTLPAPERARISHLPGRITCAPEHVRNSHAPARITWWDASLILLDLVINTRSYFIDPY